MRIFLIGMPGSGKSTLGRQIADQLRLPFVDLDAQIEQHEEMKISEIFKREGEAYFRESEYNHLKEYAAAHKNFVMATGGGAPCFFDAMEFMKQEGITVFLNTSIARVVARFNLEQTDQRPLVKNKTGQELVEFLTRMFERRSPFYLMAEHVLESDDLKPDTVTALLKAHANS